LKALRFSGHYRPQKIFKIFAERFMKISKENQEFSEKKYFKN